MGTYQPIRLTLKLATPVALNHEWIHFDSLLLHLYALAMDPILYSLPTKKAVYWYESVLPTLFAVSSHGIPLASASIFHEPKQYITLSHYKRTDQDVFPQKKLNISSGIFRNHQWRNILLVAPACTFYATVNLRLLHELLPYLTHLGNDTRIGWGRVLDYELERLDEDRSLCYEGRAMRPIPVRLLQSYEYALLCTTRPPYWHPDSLELCAPPNSQIEWRNDV